MVARKTTTFDKFASPTKLMARRIFITPQASLDLDEIYNFIAQNNPDKALQFFDSARQTFNLQLNFSEFLQWFQPNYSTPYAISIMLINFILCKF